MIKFLSEYTKNIATFLIFISIIGIILPSNKYKNYINLILGFILIFIIITPLSKILGKTNYDVDVLLEKMFWETNHTTYIEEGEYFQGEQNEQILKVYASNLTKQIEGLVEGQEKFQLVSASLDVGKEEEDFGKINSMDIKVKRLEQDNMKKRKIIHIEPVIINKKNNNNLDEINNETQEDVNVLKTFISNFYNLSEVNINIQVVGN